MDGETTATLALTAVTLLLCGVTVWLVFETKGAAKRQLEVQTWLEVAKRFDSREMKSARKATAAKLQAGATHEEISETVCDYFEDVGTLLRFGYIERKLVESSLAFYGVRWWEALRSYVYEERRNHNGDTTIFEDFERLGKEMVAPTDKIDDAEMKRFMADEARLVID